MENASSFSPTNPHFFQPLLPGFLNHLNIPISFFSKHIKGTSIESCTMVKLRSKASDVTWEVKLDGRRLTQGWQNFADSHNLRIGDIVALRHEGDLFFHVTCFGPSFCEILYVNDEADDVIQIYSDSDSDKYQHTREAGGSSSDNSCFVTRVTASNLRKNLLFLPIDFCREKSSLLSLHQN